MDLKALLNKNTLILNFTLSVAKWAGMVNIILLFLIINKIRIKKYHFKGSIKEDYVLIKFFFDRVFVVVSFSDVFLSVWKQMKQHCINIV